MARAPGPCRSTSETAGSRGCEALLEPYLEPYVHFVVGRWPVGGCLSTQYTRRYSLTSEAPTRRAYWSSSCARRRSRRPTAVVPQLKQTAAVKSSMSLMNIKLETNHHQASCLKTEVGMGSASSNSENAQEFGGDHHFRRSQAAAQRSSTGEREQQATSSRPAHGSSNAPARYGGMEADRGCRCRPRFGSAPILGVAAGGTPGSN